MVLLFVAGDLAIFHGCHTFWILRFAREGGQKSLLARTDRFGFCNFSHPVMCRKPDLAESQYLWLFLGGGWTDST